VLFSEIRDTAGRGGDSYDRFLVLLVSVSSSSWAWWDVDWGDSLEWKRSVFLSAVTTPHCTMTSVMMYCHAVYILLVLAY